MKNMVASIGGVVANLIAQRHGGYLSYYYKHEYYERAMRLKKGLEFNFKNMDISPKEFNKKHDLYVTYLHLSGSSLLYEKISRVDGEEK